MVLMMLSDIPRYLRHVVYELQTGGDNRSSTHIYAWRIMYVLINQAHLGHEGAKECMPVIGPFFFFFSSLSHLKSAANSIVLFQKVYQ